jgi:cholesterol transport system auxiliary component
MVYVKQPFELSYYAVNQWVDAPAYMIAPALVRAMERTGAWKSVVQAPTTVRGHYRLETEQLSLEQQFFESPSLVRIALRAQLLDLRSHAVIGTKWFEVMEAAPSDDAYGGVVAASRASGRLLDDLAMWASACVKRAEDC